MREISEATLAILKSQNLTGQNRFSHSLKLEGVDFYTDIKNILPNTIKIGGTWADYCIRSDGKVLITYSVGINIYLSVVDSEEAMLSIDNSAGTGVLFYTLGEIGGESCFSLIRLKNGKILLIITDRGRFNAPIPYTTKVYMSSNGLGDDFVLANTLHSSTRIDTSSTYLRSRISKAAQGKDGSIFFSTWERVSLANSSDGGNVVIYKSVDNGITWIKKYSYFNSDLHLFRGLGAMTIINNLVFVSIKKIYGTLNSFLFISSDYGETWSLKNLDFSDNPANIDNAQVLIDFTSDLNDSLYMIIGTNDRKADIYKAKTIASLTFPLTNLIGNWELLQTNIDKYFDNDGYLSISPKGTIHYLHKSQYDMYDTGMFRDEYSSPLSASSISISKGKGGSNTATIQASNKDGILNPKNPDSPLYKILGTNKQIIIKQGYGDEMVETFTGMIDDFDMSTWPQTTGIALRDNLKKALDQTITNGNQHTVDFVSQPIENIVGYLCYLADIEVGVDAIEATGISVAMNFSWSSYADAFQQLGDLASFEWGCDSYGKFYFRRDYQPDNMFVAYTFEEGIDLATLKYKISDKDLYSKVVVFGKSGDTVISYEAPFLDAALYNILPQKILKIDATEANTVGALQKIAERSLSMMQSRTAVIQFTSIAIPWLEVGDFIGIYERSTGAASIYRLSDLGLNMDKDSFTMSGTAYYYGDSIVPGELPTDTATQTVAPTVNLIPEMTSNVAPSGVARASSIYTSNYEPWQAFNSHSDDYYWNSITNTGWIEYQFPEKTIVDKYMLKARQLTIYNDAMPRDWTFEGFDGEKWVVLDRQTGQTNWGVYQSRTYLFANTVAYSKYRLNVSRNDGYMRLQLEQLAMYYGGGA